MGVYIPNMEMPTSCEDCPLGDSLHCEVLPSVPALWAEYTNAIREKRLHSECPLVPVPSHGRLIDADVLPMEESVPTVMMHDGERWISAYELAMAPTIIPADRKEVEA